MVLEAISAQPFEPLATADLTCKNSFSASYIICKACE
uniref:Uncharacterized protein n=1 Tax=Anguilla anguilla TaxID=7936 RepID=A0A0E9Q6J7_ANGAN